MNEAIAQPEVFNPWIAAAHLVPAPVTWLDIYARNRCRLFVVAALVTGSFESAKVAIEDSIDCIDERATPQLRAALLAVAATSISRIRDGGASEETFALPGDLVAVKNLRPDLRVCFVLRRLVGLTSAETSKLLSLKPCEVEQRTVEASLELVRTEFRH